MLENIKEIIKVLKRYIIKFKNIIDIIYNEIAINSLEDIQTLIIIGKDNSKYIFKRLSQNYKNDKQIKRFLDLYFKNEEFQDINLISHFFKRSISEENLKRFYNTNDKEILKILFIQENISKDFIKSKEQEILKDKDLASFYILSNKVDFLTALEIACKFSLKEEITIRNDYKENKKTVDYILNIKEKNYKLSFIDKINIILLKIRGVL